MLSRFDEGRLASRVRNPAVDPTGKNLIFEFNQQIWHMSLGLDNAEPKELIYSGFHLRFPTWSPDGKTIVYLGLSTDDNYHPALMFTNIEAGQSHLANLGSILPKTVIGPISWR